DENGLNETHRKILEYIHQRGQAGERAIAATVGLQAGIYREVYEPALLHKNLIAQGSRGRVLAEEAKLKYFNGCGCKQCLK
ncbi:MAG: Holliday junction branch migration DNA helicase RuvB, partial [Gammaproteobacteria bacterium SHHR-1]